MPGYRTSSRPVAVVAFFVAIFGLLLPAPSASAASPMCEQALLDKISKDTGKKVSLVIVTSEGPRLVAGTLCQKKDEKCVYVVAADEEALLPKGKIDGIDPGAAVSFGESACGASGMKYKLYSPFASPTTGCPAEVGARTESGSVSFYFEEAGAPRLVGVGAGCPGPGCKSRLVSTDPNMLPLIEDENAEPLGACKATPVDFVDRMPTSSQAPPSNCKSSVGDVWRPQDIARLYRGEEQVCVQEPRIIGGGQKSFPGLGALGTGSAVTDAATEAIQILGQIVVDRASEAGYRRLRDEVKKALHCDDAETSPTLAGPRRTDWWNSFAFPRTCRVLNTIRIQDLAMSRSAILQALASDAIETMRARLVAKSGVELSKNFTLALDAMAVSVVPELAQIQAGGSSAPGALVNSVVEELVEQVAKDPQVCSSQANMAAVLSATAVAKCHLQVATQTVTTLGACPVAEYVAFLAPKLCAISNRPKAAALAAAKTISTELLQAEVAVKADGTPDVRARSRYAVDAAFDTACLFLGNGSIGTCPASVDFEATANAPDATEDVKNKKALTRVASVMRALIKAAIDGDTNTVVAALGRGVELVIEQVGAAPSLSGPEKQRLLRGLRLLSGLLQYAETFTTKSAKDDAAALHERRTKILEALTREMTDRTGRESDDIFSLGGSLRAVAGVRMDLGFSGQQPVFFGPVSLPLGFGFQSARGLHLELGLVDLGQYLSFQEASDASGKTGVQVREPEPADLLAPSFTVGHYWGKDFPFFVGLTIGYAPQYRFDPNAKKNMGSLNLGLTAGVYVPLFDIN